MASVMSLVLIAGGGDRLSADAALAADGAAMMARSLAEGQGRRADLHGAVLRLHLPAGRRAGAVLIPGRQAAGAALQRPFAALVSGGLRRRQARRRFRQFIDRGRNLLGALGADRLPRRLRHRTLRISRQGRPAGHHHPAAGRLLSPHRHGAAGERLGPGLRPQPVDRRRRPCGDQHAAGLRHLPGPARRASAAHRGGGPRSRRLHLARAGQHHRAHDRAGAASPPSASASPSPGTRP